MLSASHETDRRRFDLQCNFYNWSKCVEIVAEGIPAKVD